MGQINLERFRPNLAAATEDYDWSKLVFPVYVSPKLDGIRCVTHPTLGASSRSLKPIPNRYIREILSLPELRWLDGEIMIGAANAPDAMQKAQSGVMTHDGRPDFTYHVFDNFEAGHMCGFGIRLGDAERTVMSFQSIREQYAVNVRILQHHMCDNLEELWAWEEKFLVDGYEGMMVRSPGGKYKFGRSTLREQGLLKVKRFTDAEAIITDWAPLEINANDPMVDALGLQKRGYSKDGKVIDDSRVGRFYCIGVEGSQFAGVGFWIGSGLDDDTRRALREAIRTGNNSPLGKRISYKYQMHGSKDAPRSPIWKGFRSDE